MKGKITLLSAVFAFVFISFDMMAQGTVPEILYYKFDQTGTTVTNSASNPPAGTATATIVGGQSQGSTGLCGGALIGTGGSGTTDYVSTGWNTNLGNSPWTIAFWIDQLPNNTTLHYQFGDPGAASFRCFNNGVAGAGNFMLRGPVTDVECTGCAPNGVPSMSVFVYDPTLGNIKAYHDGVLVNTVAQGTLSISGSGFSVGGTSGTGMGAGQLMDEFRFYDRALDATEVFDTYMACLPLVQLNNDAGIVNFVNPVIPTCQFNDSVSVTLKNHGTDTLTSVNINWKRNTTTLTPLFWTGSLAPQADTVVYVGSTPYVSGDNLYAWTTNPNGVVENPAGSYNDSSEITGLSTGLTGTYTIGGTTPDFSDIPSAVAALNFAGICGPIVFNIRTGTYTDQFNLSQVIGMNATNTVTFRSEAGHRDSVIINYISTGTADNFVAKLSNADYFRLESMTLRNNGGSYGRVIDVSGGSDYNVIYDCNLQTQANSTTNNNVCVIHSPSGSIDNFNRIEGNTISGGSYGFYWYGSGTTSLEEGTEILNNELVDNYYYGMRLDYHENIHVIGNRIYGQSTYTGSRYGFYANYCDKASIVTHNSIESNSSSNWTYGMEMVNCDATSAARALFANNSVTVGAPGQTSTKYALYFSNNGYFDVFNNSSSVIGGSTSSRALYFTGGGASIVKNNTFTNFDGSYAVYIASNYSIIEMDYNNLYTTGSNIGYFGSNTATFADWQLESGFDANGVNVDPGFYSDYDLHACSDSLNNKGTPLALVMDDRDFQPRNASTPDIGSDEFSPLTLPGFLGPDALVCTGQSVSLYAGTPADQILWSTGDSTSTLVVTTPGTYTVTVIGACGTSFDTITVTTSALVYTGYLLADTMTFCTGGSALLTSSMPATSYSWTGGSTNDSLIVTTGGSYTLNITDACGTGSESVLITEYSAPVAGFTSTSSFLTGVFTNTSTGGGTQTYLWDFGDATTSTQMNPSHVYSSVGTFTVTLTVTNECGTNTTTQTINTSNLGLEEVAGVGTIAVYPNPSTGVFNVDFNTNNDVNISIQVTNVLGQSVYTKNIGSINGTHKDAINITNEAPGVYYVTIVSNEKTVMTSKLIKQ